MVLLSVLGAIGLIYILVVQMSSDVLFTSQYYQKVHFKERSYYIARSTLGAMQGLFAMDDADVDSLQDVWAQELPPYSLDDEQINVIVTVEDQERFVNPNQLLSNNPDQEKDNKAFFERLLKTLEIEPDYVNALMDWIDDDQERRIPLGADGMDYSDYPAKNGKLDSVAELKLIKGFDEFYNGRVSMDRAVPGLKDLLTVHSNGKININTAPKEILMSLDDEMNEGTVAELLRKREEEPISKLEDLVDSAGMTHDLIYRLKKYATVKSEHFKLNIRAESYDERDSMDLIAVFKREKTKAKIVYWRAQ